MVEKNQGLLGSMESAVPQSPQSGRMDGQAVPSMSHPHIQQGKLLVTFLEGRKDFVQKDAGSRG